MAEDKLQKAQKEIDTSSSAKSNSSTSDIASTVNREFLEK